MKPQVGDKVVTWFSDQDDKKSTVLGVRPYDGLYKQYFTYWIKLTAPRTNQGWLEVCE